MTESGQDLFLELQNKVRLSDQALYQIGARGREYAQAESDYRQALAKKMLSERDKGTPVSIIPDICRGDAEVAAKKMQRDIAEVVYKSAMEACNVYKLQIRVLENQIEREWNRT